MPDIVVKSTTYPLPPDDSQAQKVPLYNAAISALAAVAESPPKARVYHSMTQSLTTATQTALSFDSERWDTDTIHDNSTNNSRLTCKTAGLYLIIGQVGYAFSATGVRQTSIRLNGVTYLAAIATQAPTTGTFPARHIVSTTYPLAVNDYVEVMAYQESGGALNTEVLANAVPEFQMIRLGA